MHRHHERLQQESQLRILEMKVAWVRYEHHRNNYQEAKNEVELQKQRLEAAKVWHRMGNKII